MNLSTFSIVIPTKGRPSDLRMCIESVLRQSKPPMEIIVVDGSSDDSTIQALARLDTSMRVVRVKQEVGLFARAKNIGARAANGNIVFFVDDDVVLDSRYIEEVEKIYNSDLGASIGGVKGICTNLAFGSFNNAFCRSFGMTYFGADSHLLRSGFFIVPRGLQEPKAVDCFSGPTMSFRRVVLSEFSFDENFEYGDELNFSSRVAKRYRLIVTPNAKYLHHMSMTNRNLRQRQKMNTFAHYYLFRRLLKNSYLDWLHFGWSHIGFVLAYIGILIVRPSRQNSEMVMGTIDGTFLMLQGVERPR
jgi:glucosyl-dolichyl phosphate glucuronosyltransferase